MLLERTLAGCVAILLAANAWYVGAQQSSQPGDPVGRGAGAGAAAPTPDGPAATASSVAPVTTESTIGTGRVGKQTPKPSDHQMATPTPTAPPRSLPKGATPGFPLLVKLTPPCVQPGGTLRVDVDTVPRAAMAAAAMYRNGKTSGQLTVGEADAVGHWAWQIIVPAHAPIGENWIRVTADEVERSPDGEGASATGRNGHETVPFEVKETC